MTSLFPVCPYGAEAGTETYPLRGFLKESYHTEDTVAEGLDPNVLFLLDTSTAMTFAPWGVMPNKNDRRPGESESEAIHRRGRMLKGSTYGHGMRPPRFGAGEGEEATILTGEDGKGHGGSYSRYGREFDITASTENNLIGDPNCYYTSDPDKFFLLTFRNRHLAHYTGWIVSDGVTSDGREKGRLNPPNFGANGNLPNGGVVGYFDDADVDLGKVKYPVPGGYWTEPRKGGEGYKKKDDFSSWGVHGNRTSVYRYRAVNRWRNEREAAENAYKALHDYIPAEYVKNASGVWVPVENRRPVPFDAANVHLVPNDSRIYKMKLVLWRMTEESNKEMLARMNVAAAISYQDVGINLISAATKIALPGAAEGEGGYYGATEDFPYGNAAHYVLGTQDNRDRPYYNPYSRWLSQWTRRGVLVELYDDASPGQAIWNTLSRAVMYVPFSKLYQASGAGMVINPTGKLEDFRSYMRGYEHYNATNDDVTVKPIKDEFWASSLTLLSTAIYGGRSGADNITGFNHFPLHKGKTVTYSFPEGNNKPTGTDEHMIQFAVTSKDNAGSAKEYKIFLEPSVNSEGLKTGQAVGSVFDFFNPPDTNNATGMDGVRWSEDTAGFFPVTGSCQQNWLVVFCAGNSAVPGYTPAQAVNKLFHESRTVRGRILDTKGTATDTSDDKWTYGPSIAMDSGIRTLVVGFLPDEKDDEDPSVKAVRADLREMAKEGDPVLITDSSNPDYGKYVRNEHAAPYFANDVPGLIDALNNVLKRIYVVNMGSGEPVNLPNILELNGDGSKERIVFGATYKMNPFNQWDSWLRKMRIVSPDKGREYEVTELWEANDRMRLNTPAARKLRTASGAGTAIQVDAGSLTSLAGIPAADAGKFADWLKEYDEGLKDSTLRMSILGDMIHSGITVVGKPKALSANLERDPLVYTQTNRGVLHALSYASGDEKWAFIPPNVFQSDKLKGLKFEYKDNAWKWMEGNGFTQMRSNPMVLLDGMLIARDIPDVSLAHGGKTVLTGYLGSGGNGFYTMDITKAGDEPVFMWAVENARYADTPAVAPVESVIKRWGAAADASAVNAKILYDYRDLGLTVVPGVCFDPVNNGSAVGVLPGGLGHKLGKGGDMQGKAFYFFNPLDGSIISKIDTAPASRFEAPAGVSLGMGISPVVYHENSAKKAVGFYTADSEGNLLMCDNLNELVPNWNIRSVFQLRTLGSSVPYELGNTQPAPAFDLPVAIPRRVVYARAGSKYSWVFGGTSDIYGPGSRKRGNSKEPHLTDPVSGGSDEPDRYSIRSAEHYIFGVNVTNALKGDAWKWGITPMNEDVRKLAYFADGIPVEYGTYGRDGYDFNPDDEAQRAAFRAESKKMNDYGWVLRLRPGISGKTDPEYLSAEPYLFGGVLFAATFIPRVNAASEEECADVGVGKLYMLDPSTGKSLLRVPSYVLENTKIAGFSGSGKRMTMSVKELKAGAFTDTVNALGEHDAMPVGENTGMIDFEIPQKISGGADIDILPNIPHIQYWRDIF